MAAATETLALPARAEVIDALQPIVIHPPIHGVLEDDALALLTDDRAESDTVTEPPVAAAPALPETPSTVEVTPAPAPEAAPAAPRRAFSLDALRGLFLLTMTLGFTVRGTELPTWMYHRQFTPPDFALNPVAGISWRDLTYVAFLFTMAAALPITLSRRIAKGETEIGIVAAAIKRYGLLLLFALLIGHANTFFIGYTQTARAIAVTGFVVMALVFTRRRPDWNERWFAVVRRIGWVAAIAFLALTPLAYGKTFSFTRMDDVIAGLAFASLAGAVTWYFTRDNLPARLGVLAAAVALYLGSRAEGWVQDWWYGSPVPWAFAPSRLSLLTIVVAGTIAGDIIVRWIRSADAEHDCAAPAAWGSARLWLLALLALGFAPVITVGLYNREVLLTTQLTAAMIVVGIALTQGASTALERMLRSLFIWGSIWMLLGLFAEPFEGGIKKVPETLSYFFTVSGISTMLLVAMTTVIDALKRERGVRVLIDVGHNPMLCYVLYTVLLNSLLEMIPPLRGVLRDSTGALLLRSLLEVTAVILIVRFVTKRRVYWRT